MSTSRRHKSKQDFKNLRRVNAVKKLGSQGEAGDILHQWELHSDDTMDVDVGEGAHEHVAGQGGSRQYYNDWVSSESDDGFCIQTDRSQGAEDEYSLDFNQNAGKRIVMTLKMK